MTSGKTRVAKRRANRHPVSIGVSIGRLIAYAEDAILIVLLTAMIAFAVTQIVLRNLFEAGIVWADPLLRVLVLWVGMAGAMVATRLNNHISINVLSNYLSARWQARAQVLVDLFTAAVCAVFAVAGTTFVLNEYEAGTLAFAQVPSWVAALIVPAAFAVIGLRYLLMAITRRPAATVGAAHP